MTALFIGFSTGGSDAVATQVEVDGRLLIRKFITGAPARKLRAQAGYLCQPGSHKLPPVRVVSKHMVR